MVSVINTVDTSHEDMIHDAQMDYYGTRLATCSSDRSVKIFDVRNGGQILIADLRGHEGPVWQVAWAHPMYGNILASCSYDRKVIIWKEENGTWEKTHEHSGHDSSVNSVCWAPHDYGLILACGSSDGAISLLTYTGEGQWEVKKINNAHTIGCNAVSWAPAVVPGSLIDQPSGQKPNYIKKFASGGCDNLIKLWREEEDGQWKEEQKLEAHSDWVRDVAWAPSIGLPTSTIASCSQDGRVFIWTCDDASGNMWSPKLLHKFNDVVWHVSWSITANILAVSGGDNKIGSLYVVLAVLDLDRYIAEDGLELSLLPLSVGRKRVLSSQGMQYCPRKVDSSEVRLSDPNKHKASYIRSSQAAGTTSPGIPGPSVTTIKAMLSSGTICSLLLLSVLWMDVAMTGSSFLSPEHQKAQRKESKKPPAKLQPRSLEGWLHPEGRGQAEGTEEELEIRFNAPFDVGIKLSGAQYQQHGRALGKFLQDILWEEVKEVPADK
ncbi:protein SEC13 homolog isoform X3 [Peromyscus californicus insignis]|uniref:protein SEC13 homolog isoform X3 n=1 Tax=Peromyscus californicus insignis TaxID=564181 RepID=UPI0022A77445|nr:protein SEC13 homolog isoform X3 [Peromyscus californicus insignis]